jgi:hypothetical protein
MLPISNSPPTSETRSCVPQGTGRRRRAAHAFERLQVDLCRRQDLAQLVVQLDGEAAPLLLLGGEQPARQHLLALASGLDPFDHGVDDRGEQVFVPRK